MNEPTDIDFFRRTGFMYEVEGRSNSEFHGDGLFTKEDIPKGSVVFYWGLAEGDTHISEETYLEKRKDMSDEVFQKTSARWIHDIYLEGQWGPDCYINHSDDPNILCYCGLGIARRDIKAEDEIHIDFRYILSENDLAHFVNIETNEKIIGVSNYESVTRGAQQLIELLEGDNK